MDSNRRREKLFFLMLIGTLGIILLIIGGAQFIEFTDSSAFCGQVCHSVMAPEYTVYQASPHSRVPCADCHVGPGADYFVKSKIEGTRELYHFIVGDYNRPLEVPVENLRPARETCEACHRPEKFTGDLVRTRTTFLTNEANTPEVDTRVLRIGGGEAGTAHDIHWHIAAKVWYLPSDSKRQDIAWVGVEDEKGGYAAEYTNPQKASGVEAKQIASGRLLMDCVDCHNRATHIFQTPEGFIDAAIVQGKINKGLPFIKREGARALYPPNSSLDQAYTKLDAIGNFYKTNYPQVYTSKKDSIDKSIAELKNIARLTTFPDMKVNWETYADNLGHRESDGCFRCHGKLVTTTGKDTGKTVDVRCDLCHYLIPPQ